MTKPSLKDRLAQAIDEMVTNGIYFSEAASEFEKLFIQRALEESEGSVSQAAQIMGIHRNTLSKKVRQYGLRR